MDIDIYKKKAKKINVEIKPSKNKNKKFDAFVNGVFQNSFGAKGYKDYEIYKKENGLEFANERRRLYRKRHARDMNIKMRDGKLTAGYLSNKILW
tara:strand:+ start:431 stop:715 length:285 start_codon:yes stop_codon:yes gene_type:complete